MGNHICEITRVKYRDLLPHYLDPGSPISGDPAPRYTTDTARVVVLLFGVSQITHVRNLAEVFYPIIGWISVNVVDIALW